MIVGVERYRQFITSTVLAAAVSVVWIGSGSAQTQEATAHEQSTADNRGALFGSRRKVVVAGRIARVAGDDLGFYLFFLRYGWSIGTEPDFLVNWQAPRNQRLTFPIGPQIGKL